MTVLLDTCVLVDILNNRLDRRALFNDLSAQRVQLASCAITVAEVYAGMRPKEADKTGELFAALDYFETRESTAKLGGDLKAAWLKKGHTLSITDTLIAAVALEHGLMVATDNIKHFPMPELRLLALPRPN